MIYESDTIAAISTSISESGIGIVRMTGKDAFEIIDKMYKGKKNKKLSDQKTHTIHYGHIVDNGKIIDEILVMLMRAPHTFTGEDTVEVNCHGGVYVVKSILNIMIQQGARPAEPGEFTKRAFLNGKMDLSQAEAVGDLIASKNEYALKSSIGQLNGSIKKIIKEIRNKIIYHTAFIETALDDPEHINVDGYSNELKITVNELLAEIEKLIKTYDNGRIIKEGIKTVIVGKPNAGKSSLLNIMLGEERAIVTEIAGTTRDSLEEYVNLSGISLNIIDTAGIRETEDIVEKIGVDKAKVHVEEADLIIYVIDASIPLDDNDSKILEMIQGKPVIILLNKTDLHMLVKKEDIENKYYARYPAISMDYRKNQVACIEVSTKTRSNISEIEQKIKELVFDGNLAFNDEVYITNARQKVSLQDAYKALKKVNKSIENRMPEDFYSIDLIDAYESLGNITGETMGEDLVNEIFSKFCMGK